MNKLLFSAIVLFFLLSLPGAHALKTPNVTFIPPVLSVNSSFLAVADAGDGASIRVGWTVPGVENAYGLFPRTDDGFICYFSSSDSKSTCGPVPFEYSTIGLSPYTMFVEAIDQYKTKTNLTEQVNIGGISVSPTIQVTGNTVYMVVSSKGGIPTAMYYSAHKMDLTPVHVNRQLDYNIITDRFTGNVDLEQGEYYLSFWGALTGNSDWGSSLARITVGEAGAPTGPTALQADEVKVYWLINKGQTYQQTGFKLSNLGGSVTNLTVSIPDALDTYLDIVLDKDNLGTNESTFFTVKFAGSQTDLRLNGDAEIKSGSTVLGTFPFQIRVSLIDGGAVTCPTVAAGEELTVAPAIWTASGVAGEELSRTFTITNDADSDATSLGYTLSGAISTIATVELPSTVMAAGTGTATVTVTPTVSGVYTGAVKITSTAGPATIVVGLDIEDDMSSQIEDAKDELESAELSLTAAQEADPIISSLIDDITSRLDSAESDFDAGSYELAKRELEGARGRIAALSSVAAAAALAPTPSTPAAPAGGDMTVPIILIVALIAIMAVAGWFYFTKVKKGKKELEKELEEEY